jgi:hypothetical protein
MIFINGKPIAFATWEHLQDGVKKGIIIKLGSPVTTYINDTEGNVTGYVDGDILEEIPDSFYIPAGTRFYTNSGDPTAFWDANETIFVGGDTGIRNYSTVITGTDDGHYELILAYVHADGQIDGSTIQFDIRKGETQTYDISVNSSGEISVVGVPARIDIDPDTINLSAPSRWVTCYIGLPEGFDVNLIDGETVQLDGIPSYIGKEGWAQAEANQWNIVDHDGDGIPERMVKFDSLGVELLLSPGNATVTVCGQLFDGTNFERTDTIKVINKRVK